MKVVKVDNEELSQAISAGDAYIQVGNRKFMLFEVEEVYQTEYYEADSVEELLLREAMDSENPSLTKKEVLERLSHRGKK
jgi:hypothetical protein